MNMFSAIGTGIQFELQRLETSLWGGDVAAPNVVQGLLDEFHNNKAFIIVRFQQDAGQKCFVMLYSDGRAVFRDNDGVILPPNADVVQRARVIASNDSTAWKELLEMVVTVNYFKLTEATGDVAAPNVVQGLLDKYENTKEYILVRFRAGAQNRYVVLYSGGQAHYQTSNMPLPYDAAVVQRARDIAANDATEWKVEHGRVITVLHYSLDDESGA